MSDLPAHHGGAPRLSLTSSAIVDTVSSCSALPIKKDELGIDVLITGSQKAFAMPPGLVDLLDFEARARQAPPPCTGRGYYFDFLEFQKNHEGGMTPSTPVIPLIYALESKLEDIKAEGLENRYARHARLNQTVRDWAYAKGFKLFPRKATARSRSTASPTRSTSTSPR
jgi:aspartate aminotransferase-like enzyme